MMLGINCLDHESAVAGMVERISSASPPPHLTDRISRVGAPPPPVSIVVG